ncbi:hypothetical protein QE152_g30479 [Popillia japonica]|uniref:Uncharacterized protein n=1 Tax=Popillia japonica TaxID=7064 RepID=A0AAW1JFI4_POPJA
MKPVEIMPFPTLPGPSTDRKRRSGSAVPVSGSPYTDELETKLQNSASLRMQLSCPL